MNNKCVLEQDAGSKRCNTDPTKCIELSNGIKVVNHSVDSLYISFNGELKKGLLEYLETVKQEAIDSDGPSYGLNYNGGCLVIQPHGKMGYPYLLDGEDFSLKIGEGKVGPSVYAEIRAHYLYTLGFEKACKEVMNVIDDLVEEGEYLVSRIDLCTDLVGWYPPTKLEDFMVTRARKKDIHYDGNKLTGFSYGKGGAISCRIYNKSVEIAGKGNKWVEEIWKEFGWNDDLGEVWRVEYQLRREALKQFGVNEPKDVFAALNSIWEYCLTEWLCLRVPYENDKTKSRWPIESWWQELSAIKFNESTVEAVRNAYKAIQFQRVLDGLIAYQTSLAAHVNIFDFETANKIGSGLSLERLNSRKKTFSEIVVEKRKRKGL